MDEPLEGNFLITRFGGSLGRVADRDQADRPDMIGQPQNVCYLDRIVGADETGAQVLLNDAEQISREANAVSTRL